MLSLSDWITTLSLVFGGCCSNAITLEHITSRYPNAGVLITFFQFLIVSLYGLPKQFTFNDPPESKHAANGPNGTVSAPTTPRRRWIPRLKNRQVPLLPYFIQVALFFVLSTLNNAAFAYHIPMTVHIVFRSGGMIINMILGWMFTKKRYTVRQVASVLVVTVGIIITTLSASKPKSRVAKVDTTDASLYAMGISILGLALVLSGFLGLIQDWVFARYVAPAQAEAASDPAEQSSWQEHMFYLHSLALPMFYFSKDNISTELTRMSSSPPVFLSLPQSGPLAPYEAGLIVPSIFVYLLLNTCTQLVCVIGVNRLTGRVSSLTVTLILTVRKAISLLLSVAFYGGQGNTEMWAGAGLVFIGTIGYSTGNKSKDQKEKKD
ncbi:UAA transporter [Suillus subalutaceus]|uniref:UAA transporter n=1 Tax=Suillus subalutaceus TaxID=48586 RepID=UPI001B8807C1|nr:UAA transporter [Suillus subalutaceus]KAG1843476.1 UAA transporter [Suillus subalutaceus]